MKALQLTLLLLFFSCSLLFANGPNKTWTLIHQKDGIEFYATSIMSHSDKGEKILLKIKNTNTNEARIQFFVGQSCDENDNKPHENTLIGANGMVMFTYASCQNNPLASLQIEQFKLSE